MADEYRGSVRTQVNVIMGTPAYMAPEQCRGSKGVADKTDVYALGVMLFEQRSDRPRVDGASSPRAGELEGT